MTDYPDITAPIPVSVIVMTKNEEPNIRHSLAPLLAHFDEVFVVDSHSTDNTPTIARRMGVRVIPFSWNGRYPKKKQWCADTVPARNEWIFICDADEIMTDDFIRELRTCPWDMDGYFVASRPVWNGRLLKYGMRNNKLCLYKKTAFTYPVVNDLEIDGGWEVEGHYQPIPASPHMTIGQIKSPIIHHDAANSWVTRHERYARWEAGMNAGKSWPQDPVRIRRILKWILRRFPMRPSLTFIYAYILKAGFMDGRAGLDYALKRRWYACRIRDMSRVIRRSSSAR